MVQTAGAANIRADISQGLAALGRGFERRNALQREQAKQAAVQKELNALLQDEDVDQQAALLRIGQLAGPAVQQQVRETLERGDAQEIIREQKLAEQRGLDAIRIKNITDPALRSRAIREIAEEKAAEGDDISGLVDLMNMPPAEQDLFLDSEVRLGADFQTLAKNALKPPTKTPLQKNLEAAGVDMQSAEGKALMLKMLAKPGVQVNVGDGSFKLPPGFKLKEPGNPSAGVTPIPGGPADKLTPEQASKAQMLTTALKASEGIRELVFKKDGTLDLVNILNMRLNTPRSLGRKLKVMMEPGIQAITRGETGAAMPPEEVENTRLRFSPAIGDTPEIVNLKLDMFQDFMTGTLKLIDPSGRFNNARFNSEFEIRKQEIETGNTGKKDAIEVDF